MDNEMKIVEDQESNNSILNEEELKLLIEEQLSKTSSQSRVVGFKVGCKIILDKIIAFESLPGNKSNNDHKRLIKDIKKFCEIGLGRNKNANDKTESIEETTQN